MSGSGNASLEGKALREFVSEAEEILDQLLTDLADLFDQRSSLDSDAEVDPDLLNRVFRSAHSLKGLAGMFGLDAIGDLAHHLEDVLDGLRLGRIAVDSPAVSLLESVVLLAVSLLEGVGDPDQQAAAREAASAKIEELRSALQEAPAEEEGFSNLSIDPQLLRALTEYEEHRLRESIRRGRHLSLVDSVFEMVSFEEGLAELSAAIREVGEVVSTLPSPGDSPERQIRFSLLVATQISVDQLRTRLELPNTTVQSVLVPAEPQDTPGDPSPSEQATQAPVPPETDPLPSAETPPSSGESDGAVAEGEAKSPDIASLRSISGTVRVDIAKLDELMNLVGELVIQRAAIEEIASKLASEALTTHIGQELTKANRLLDRKLKELQAGVLEVRMVPLRQVFEKLSRVVRRLRRDLDKDVALEFSGADTELDKLIVEQLVDPLMHIVRNAVDHAIEPEEERAACGKPRQGMIHIEASQRGNYVLVEVRDDGRGLDPTLIRARAEEMDLVDPSEVLSEKEIFDLLFLPGFSTRSEVSETSGRGVGMDVVRSNLTSLGGIVELRSDLGRGTAVTLTLPITLAIIRALVVVVGDHRYAIPLNSVLETLLIADGEIQRSEGREILNLRGQPLLLRRLSEELEIEETERPQKQYVVVLGLGDLRLGLVVDRIAGQQDAVIKPIRGPIQQIRGIAGATELGDQGAVLVLDIASLVEDAVRRKECA